VTTKHRIDEQSTKDIGPTDHASPQLRLLRLPEVMHRVGLRRSAIYQRMSEGRFPKCRSLGPKCSVWVEAEINAWVQSVAESSGLHKFDAPL
jgi:prophage regulatory protein